MKLKRIVFMLIVISIVFVNGGVTIFAMNTGFSTSEMSIEEQQTFLSNIKLSLLDSEPSKQAFSCFDVSDDGLIAIGSGTSEKKYISVYNASGEFQYGYVFYANQSFGVQWDDTNLIIYFVRSDVAAVFDSSGNSIELRMIDNTIDNNSYWNHSVFSEEKIHDEDKYIMKNNMGLFNIVATTYSQLIVTDSDGNETIVYDVSKIQFFKTVVIFIVVFVFVAIAVYLIILEFLKLKKIKRY